MPVKKKCRFLTKFFLKMPVGLGYNPPTVWLTKLVYNKQKVSKLAEVGSGT